MHPKYLSIDDFEYDLPEEKIARYPLPERDQSKLLVYKNKEIEESIYKNIDQYLPANSLLILNDAKVIEARILFQKPTGGLIEIFCLEPVIQEDIALALSRKATVEWTCLIGGASKWKPGQILQKEINLPKQKIILEAKFLQKLHAGFAVQLSWTPAEFSFAEILHFAGNIPLPPYLKREAESADQERYQTIYATAKGSVAAPTSGLHFTKPVFEKLHHKKILIDRVTLHVSAGTFKPVQPGLMEQHEMHAELIDVGISTIENIIEHSERFVTAVGTTSLRTLETLYWMGVKLILFKNISRQDLVIQQWDPYELATEKISAAEALKALHLWMLGNNLSRLVTKTQLLIAPGYKMKIPKALITNFHQPRSTLLLLIAAFTGNEWRTIYDYALENEFRFLSYGDGCLLFGNESFF